MYQAAIQSLLGVRRHGDTISVDPCIPSVWPEYELTWRIGETRYRFVVQNPERRSRGVAAATLDAVPVEPGAIPLTADGREHEVRVTLGARQRIDHSIEVAG
jgi:cyclic beta-1,2-glucan synthetase